jgi:hypothetical protein
MIMCDAVECRIAIMCIRTHAGVPAEYSLSILEDYSIITVRPVRIYDRAVTQQQR